MLFEITFIQLPLTALCFRSNKAFTLRFHRSV